MPTISEAIAPNLKRLREARKLNADELAEALGVSRMSVYNYEKAKGGLTAAMIRRLADFYGVEETDLVRPLKPAASAGLEELIAFMREIEWTPTRIDVLRSVLTGFAGASEKRALQSIEKLGQPRKKRE